MSNSQTTRVRSGRSFWSEEPTKYDPVQSRVLTDADRRRHQLIDTLHYPEIKLGMTNEYAVTILNAILPTIIEGRQPATLEFVNYEWWRDWNGETRRLRGAIIRDARLNVLVWVYGTLLDDNFSAAVRECLFDQFDIKPDDQQRIIACAYDKTDYSVMIQLS